MAFIDYYKILGVKKDIPQDEVKAAFRKRTKQFHPDLHPNDPKAKAKFQALTEAYDVIGDPVKRNMESVGRIWTLLTTRQMEKLITNNMVQEQTLEALKASTLTAFLIMVAVSLASLKVCLELDLNLATPANKEQKEAMIQVQPSVLICILRFLAEKLLLKSQTEVKLN